MHLLMGGTFHRTKVIPKIALKSLQEDLINFISEWWNYTVEATKTSGWEWGGGGSHMDDAKIKTE